MKALPLAGLTVVSLELPMFLAELLKRQRLFLRIVGGGQEQPEIRRVGLNPGQPELLAEEGDDRGREFQRGDGSVGDVRDQHFRAVQHDPGARKEREFDPVARDARTKRAGGGFHDADADRVEIDPPGREKEQREEGQQNRGSRP